MVGVGAGLGGIFGLGTGVGRGAGPEIGGRGYGGRFIRAFIGRETSTTDTNTHTDTYHENLIQRRQAATGTDPGTPLVVDVYMHFVTSRDQAHRYNSQIVETFTRNQVRLMRFFFL